MCVLLNCGESEPVLYVLVWKIFLSATWLHRPNLDHSQGDGLTNPMLITAFFASYGQLLFKDAHSDWLTWLILVGDVLPILIDCIIVISQYPGGCKYAYVSSFFPCTVILWNSLSAECLCLNYDLYCF